MAQYVLHTSAGLKPWQFGFPSAPNPGKMLPVGVETGGQDGTCKGLTPNCVYVFSREIKSVDDTKLFRKVKTQAACEMLQKDISMLGKQTSKWQTRCKVSKQTMCVGQKIPTSHNMLMRSNLEMTIQERDLGV